MMSPGEERRVIQTGSGYLFDYRTNSSWLFIMLIFRSVWGHTVSNHVADCQEELKHLVHESVSQLTYT